MIILRILYVLNGFLFSSPWYLTVYIMRYYTMQQRWIISIGRRVPKFWRIINNIMYVPIYYIRVCCAPTVFSSHRWANFLWCFEYIHERNEYSFYVFFRLYNNKILYCGISCIINRVSTSHRPSKKVWSHLN